MSDNTGWLEKFVNNKQIGQSLTSFIAKEGFTDRKYIRLPKGTDDQLKQVSEKLALPENIIIGFATFLFLMWLLEEANKR